MAQFLSQSRIEGPVLLEPSDISFLQTLMVETETQVENIEYQITQANEDDIKELTSRKEEKRMKIASLRNILSPIRRIPLELLSEIFRLACSSEEDTAQDMFIQYRTAVSLVCVAWKEAANGTPELWSTIHVRAPWSRRNIEQMGEWVARSSGLALKLCVSARKINSESSSSDFCCLIDYIGGICGQIGSLNLMGTPYAFIPLFRLPHTSFLMLENLRLDMSPTASTAHWSICSKNIPPQIEAFLGAPWLRHISIKERWDVPILSRLILPLEQLTSLEIELLSYSQFDRDAFRDTLGRCKNLISLAVKSFRGLAFDADFTIYLASLKFLEVYCWNIFPRPFTLLHGLTTPALESLVIFWANQDIHDLCNDLAGLRNRSVATLSTLILHDKPQFSTPKPDFTLNDLLPIFTIFPAVRSFRVQLISLIDGLIQAMIYTKGDPVLLPQLTELDVSSWDDSSVDLMVSLIHSRGWSDPVNLRMSDDRAVARLQKVTFRGPAFSNIVTRNNFNFPGLIVEFC